MCNVYETYKYELFMVFLKVVLFAFGADSECLMFMHTFLKIVL